MKKIFLSILALCLLVYSANIFAAVGDVFVDENDVSYEVTGAATCKVVGYEGTNPNVVIPSPVQAGDAGKFRVTLIDYEAFKDNEVIETVVIPKSVTTIGMDAFYNCKMLYKVIFEEGGKLDKINDYSFYNCTGLIDITIPTWFESVQYDPEEFPKIGSQGKAFVNVPNIIYNGKRTPQKDKYYGWGAKNVNGIVDGYLVYPEGDTDKTEVMLCSTAAKGAIVIPETVTTLRANAFASCTRITSVVIPANVTSFGSQAFSDCTSLTSIICKAVDVPDCSHFPSYAPAFKNVDKSIPVYVPAESVGAYKAADGWNQFPNIQAINEDIIDDLTKYTVTTSVNDEKMGTVTAGGKYDGGSDVKIEATPNEGYIFLNWSDNNTENPRVIKLTQDTSLVALFAEDKGVTYKLIVNVNDPAKGYVIGNGGQKVTETEYPENTEAIITAVPADGYIFVKWSDNNTDNPRKIMMTKDMTLTAYFDLPPVTRYMITAEVNDETMGTVTGAGVYDENAEVTLTALPNDGYVFDQWSDGVKDNPRVFPATADATFTAVFKQQEQGVEHFYAAPDLSQPMFNVLGQEVDAAFHGIVIQNGHKYVR